MVTSNRVAGSFPEWPDFLKDSDLSPEHKTLLLQNALEMERDKRKAALAAEGTSEAAKFERLKFWHNTPLVVALVGTLTIAAQFASGYLLSNQTGTLAADQDKREFAYRILETELGKIDPEKADQRANALLFLAKAGVLDGLNVAELEKIATSPKDANSKDTPRIPSTIGFTNKPNYDLPTPSDFVG
jgi:hypothetical protein